MRREPLDSDGHIEQTEAPEPSTDCDNLPPGFGDLGADDYERGEVVQYLDTETGEVYGPLYYLGESDLGGIDCATWDPEEETVVEATFNVLRRVDEKLPRLDEEDLPERLRLDGDDQADEDTDTEESAEADGERPPNELLVMECVDAPVKITKVNHIGRKDEYGDQMITAIVCRLHLESDSPDLVPRELADAAEELARVAADGDPEKSNTFKLSIGRDIRSDFYTIQDPKNRNHKIDVEDVRSPRLSVSNTGVKLRWKVEAIIAPRVAAEISENINRDGVEITIEAIQPELFSGGGNPSLKE